MSNRIKDLIGVAVVVGIVLFAYIAWAYVGAFSKSIEPSSFRSFSVSAEGEIVAIPDVAQFTFQVITEGGADITDLQTKNVDKTNAAIAFVKAQGVDAKDIKTQNFNLEPRYQYYNCSPRPLGGAAVEACPPASIVGYTITQTVQVKVRKDNFAKIGAVVSGVVENGANSVSQLSFVIDNPDEAQSNARAQAIEKAREKAKAVAKAGGFSVGRLLSIQEGGSPFYPVYDQAMEYAKGGVALSAPAPTIEPGSQEVKISVTLVYEID